MNRLLKLTLAAAVGITLVACASKQPPAPVEQPKTPEPAKPVVPETKPPAVVPQAVQPASVKPDPLKDPANILSSRVIYFDYDKDEVKADGQRLIQAHAKYLAENRNRKVRLEGHADERGSREYNMALGQRRADAVRRATTLLGVGADRIETISFGEEKPAVLGSNEEAWAKNRRVVIVYDGEK